MDSRSLRATPSQETLISLLQLEPQPIADTEKDLPPLPEEKDEKDEQEHERSTRPGHARTTSLGLSGSNHGSVYYCTPSLLLLFSLLIQVQLYVLEEG